MREHCSVSLVNLAQSQVVSIGVIFARIVIIYEVDKILVLVEIPLVSRFEHLMVSFLEHAMGETFISTVVHITELDHHVRLVVNEVLKDLTLRLRNRARRC